MKLLYRSDSVIQEMQKFVSLQKDVDFYFPGLVNMSVFVRQDDSFFVRVHDCFEEKIFWFQLYGFIDLSYFEFRRELLRHYRRFLDYYHDCFISSESVDFDLPF